MSSSAYVKGSELAMRLTCRSNGPRAPGPMASGRRRAGLEEIECAFRKKLETIGLEEYVKTIS